MEREMIKCKVGRATELFFFSPTPLAAWPNPPNALLFRVFSKFRRRQKKDSKSNEERPEGGTRVRETRARAGGGGDPPDQVKPP